MTELCLMPAPPSIDPMATRRSLLHRIRDLSDQTSWREFFALYHPLIYSVACKAGLAHDDAQDVVQETMIRISKKLPQFNYDPGLGSFRGWLRMTTRWCIIEQLRRRERLGPGHKVEGVPEDVVDKTFDEVWEQEETQTLLHIATQRARARVSDQHYQIYDCLINKGWSATKTAATLGVHLPRIYLAKCRFMSVLKTELKKLTRPGYGS